jgi:HK97 family phage major capsid protein
VRLGATIVADEDELPIAELQNQDPGQDPDPTPQYLERPEATDPASPDPPKLKEGAPKPVARVSERDMHPKRHEVAVKVVIPNDLACTLSEYPDVAQALKHDLARALALRADQAFLHGDGGLAPRGISHTGRVNPVADANLLALVRKMVSTVRVLGINGRFGCAGWILHPNVLDALSWIVTADGLTSGGAQGAWTLDAVTLLTQDGRDGGVLLGYPFISTPAARDGNATTLHFSSDWSEAWIAAYRELLTVDVSTDVEFQTDETVIRAVMKHDFVLRRPTYFAHGQWPAPEQEGAED